MAVFTVILRDVSVNPPMYHIEEVETGYWLTHGGTLGERARQQFVDTCSADDEGDKPGVSSIEVIMAFVGKLTEMDACSNLRALLPNNLGG